jgi:HPt (histidine-containing phosphotransfer) domain-containing protein
MGTEKIVVTVDPDLGDLIPGFLENRRRDLSTLRAALEQGDCRALQSTGHSLKGVGGGYGFTGLSAIGADIENAAKAGDTGALAGHIDRLADYLERVEVVFG